MWTISNEGFVRILQLDNLEKMNSINPQAIEQFVSELDIAATDNSVRVLLITGTDKIFSSGMDVNCFVNHQDPVNQAMFNDAVPHMFDTLIDFPKPIIAAVNGVAVGWGATVCGLADIVLMAESARIKCPFASLGNAPEACATYSFPLLMGKQNALWTLLSSEWVSAQKCKETGFAMDISPDDQLFSDAMAKATVLASFPTVSLVETKKLMVDPYRQTLKQANASEMDTFMKLLGDPACQEGVSAFKERREPDFSKF